VVWSLFRAGLKLVHAKFHYTSWFKAGSKPVRSRFGAVWNDLSWFQRKNGKLASRRRATWSCVFVDLYR